MTIDLYTFTTPNGYKASIMLEELGLDYNVHVVDITKDEQFVPEFLKISPNNKIPAIVDHDGPDGEPISVFETGVILIYLAQKTGKLFPDDVRGRTEVGKWLMWQVAGFGPMLGQAHHFRKYAPEKIEYGIKRYTEEANRLYGVLDKQLSDHTYVTGNEYTIADIAIYPWATLYDDQGVEIHDYPHVKRWLDLVSIRPAVKKGMNVPSKEQVEKAA